MMLAVPIFVGSAVSRKCVGSLLVRVSDGFGGVEGGGAAKLALPAMIKLFPTIPPLRLMVGVVTVATACTGMLAGVK